MKFLAFILALTMGFVTATTVVEGSDPTRLAQVSKCCRCKVMNSFNDQMKTGRRNADLVYVVSQCEKQGGVCLGPADCKDLGKVLRQY